MNRSKIIVLRARPMTMLTAPEAANIFVVSLSKTVDAMISAVIENSTMAVTSLGRRGTRRSEIRPMNPSQKKTLMSLLRKKVEEIQAPICMP